MNDSSPNLLYRHRFALIDRLRFADRTRAGLFDELSPVPLVPKGMEGDADKLPLCVYLEFGHITRWTWCHDGQWQTAEGPGTPAREMPLLTSTGQWRHIERIGLYNRVRQLAQPDGNRPLAGQTALIDALLTRAEQMYGLVDEQDPAEAGYCDAAAQIEPEE